MADDATLSPDLPARWRPNARTAYGALVTLAMVAALGTAIRPGWGTMIAAIGIPTVTVLVSVTVALTLTAVPVCLCLVQGVALGRHLEKLDALTGERVAQTALFRSARLRIAAVKPVNIGYDYVLPMLTFSVVVLFCSIGAWCAFLEPFYFDKASVVLGGFNALNKDAVPEEYQRGTFVAGATAFLGAYIYVLNRLLERLNVDDITPITFYRYAGHIVIATIVAGIARHGVGALGLEADAWIIPVSFIIGFSPDLFITALTRQVMTRWKIAGIRDDPDVATRPTALPLLMVDELQQPQIDRLGELGILSAQDLARRNPFLLWPRVPFELSLLVDWIAQAQLYVLVRDKPLQDLRLLLVPDIFALHQRLADATARGAVCTAIGLPPDSAEALVLQLENNPTFTQLREVRDALIPPAGYSIPVPATAASFNQGQRASVTGLSGA